MTFTRDQQINPLQANTSFYDWYQKENDEIIDKLNGMTVFGATSGNGILALVDNNGLLSISIGGTNGTISAGLTFTGNIVFSGNTSIKNIGYSTTGITLGTNGISFGTAVYFDSTAGYTGGIADTQSTAETIGIVTSRTSTSAYIATSGRIDGTFTAATEDGLNLSPGCVYFLSPTAKGKITTTEPSTSSQVSKPVLIAIGATAGVVIQYRGNFLNSTAAESGNTGPNTLYFTLPITGDLTDQFTVNRIVSYNPLIDPTQDTDIDEYFNDTGRTVFDGWFLSRFSSTGTTPIASLAREEDYVVGMIISRTTVGGDYIFAVTTGGSVISSTRPIGVWYLNSNFDLAGDTEQLVLDSEGGISHGKVIGIQYDPTHFQVVNNHRKYNSGTSTLLSSVSGTSVSSANVLTNGDFSIWQRTDIGKTSGYTGSENLIFADMWRRRDGITGASSSKLYSIQRQTFADIQSAVEGDPQYYLDIKAIGLSGGTGQFVGPSGGYLEMSHTIPDAKSYNSQSMVLSFYAKSTISNYVIQTYYSRYSNGLEIDKTITNDAVSLTTSWERFDVPFDVATLPNPGGDLVDDYMSVGFDLNTLVQQGNLNGISFGTGPTVSIASVCLFLGSDAGSPLRQPDITPRLNFCQKYYYSSYTADQSVAASTMINSEQPTYNCHNQTIFPVNYSSIVQWPSPMRVVPTCTIYSPLDGRENDAYNRSSTRDLRNSSGTIGYGGRPRVSIKNTSSIETSPTKDGVNVTVLGGAVEYDNIFYHIIADADYPI